MEKFIIQGGEKLRGEFHIHGAKNSALPIMAAALLADSPVVLHNCPNLTDVDYSVKILEHLGCSVKRSGSDVTIDPSGMNRYDIPDELMSCMRSSFIFLGAILAKLKKATLTPPGGCKIGLRPVNLHLTALESMGMKCVNESCSIIECSCPDGLRGAHIELKFPSVGATENILLAAVTAQGDTVIENAACEPEIVDLANFLNKMGAQIYGAGEQRIVIKGVKQLCGAEHTIIPDRIVATTIMAACAATGGEVLLKNVEPSHLVSIISVLEEMGCNIDVKSDELLITGPERLRSVKFVETMPYPGFPTDAQALFMALACIADGASEFVENVFENRYRHVKQLCCMGADIKIDGRNAAVNGVKELRGAKVDAEDLRGGAALIIAGLSANGITEIGEIEYVDRGYESIELALASLGAKIKRERI